MLATRKIILTSSSRRGNHGTTECDNIREGMKARRAEIFFIQQQINFSKVLYWPTCRGYFHYHTRLWRLCNDGKKSTSEKNCSSWYHWNWDMKCLLAVGHVYRTTRREWKTNLEPNVYLHVYEINFVSSSLKLSVRIAYVNLINPPCLWKFDHVHDL